MSARPRRNARIARLYREGATMTELACKYGLSISRISYIVKQQGARLTGEALRERRSRHSARVAKDPAVRAKIAATVGQRWREGLCVGRPRILADQPERREEYLTLRDCYGAAYARDALGIAA